MSRAGNVVSRELGQELGDALRAGLHDATEESLVVRCAIVALGPAIEKLGRLGVYTSEASVGTSGVARPNGKGDSFNRLARLDIENANVEIEINSGLRLTEIVAVDLAVNTTLWLAYVRMPRC